MSELGAFMSRGVSMLGRFKRTQHSNRPFNWSFQRKRKAAVGKPVGKKGIFCLNGIFGVFVILFCLSLAQLGPFSATPAQAALTKSHSNHTSSIIKTKKLAKREQIGAVKVAFSNYYSNNYYRTYKYKKKKYKYKKKAYKKPTYSLGAKYPSKGYLKSYLGQKGVFFDDPGLKKYQAPQKNNRYHYGAVNTYRTICVRLRDGYYWPINFAQQRSGFKKDRLKCQKSCSSKVRLFYLSSFDADNIKNMRDLKGRRYGRLKNAFLYRKQYIKEAKCKPQPWSAQAKAIHQKYALKDAERKRRMHVAATRYAEKKRIASLKRAARKITRKRGRYSKKRARYRRKTARLYRRKKRYKKSSYVY